MNTEQKILHENRVQANKFAAFMLFLLSVAAIVAISAYLIGFSSEIETTNYGNYLEGIGFVGFSCWITTCVCIIIKKGEGKWFPTVIMLNLLMAGILSSFLLRISINWAMFVLCVIYTIRYSEPVFTFISGMLTSVAIVLTQFLLVPYGFATGYLNMNFIELDQDTILHVKKGSYGIYNAIIKEGSIDMGYLYSEVVIEMFFPLLVYIAFVFVCYHIARYNRRRIIEQATSEEKINAALQEARNASEAKTNFLNSMSHDIRTPMNAVIGYTELLDRNWGDEEQRKDYIEKIKISSNQLMNLINNVLEMSRIESGKLVLKEEVIDVNKFIDDIGVMLNSSYSKKKLNIVRDFQLDHIYAKVDKSKCSEIILNIISNSIKYTPDGGTINIKVRAYETIDIDIMEFFVEVSDTGIGMSEEFLPHVFDSFARDEKATNNNISGTGLGMGIVKQLVDLMGGTITVKSKLNKGTTVSLAVPIKIADANETMEFSSDEMGVFSFKGKRFLLAEDNLFNAEIVIELLKDEGVTVEHAQDGIECIDMLTNKPDDYYDLILMDFQMPRLDGLEATRKIRELDNMAKASIPIFAMTANAFEGDKMKAFDAGMNGFISKPIDVDDLNKILGDYFKESENIVV